MGEATLGKQQIVGQMDTPSCKNHPGKVGMTACTCACALTLMIRCRGRSTSNHNGRWLESEESPINIYVGM